MARKILTALDQVATRSAITVTQMAEQAMIQQRARQWVEQVTRTIQTRREVPFLDVQQLMHTMRLMELSNLVPFLTPEEARQRVMPLLMPTLEEQKIRARRVTPVRYTEQVEYSRTQRVEPALIEQEIRELILHRTSIILIDQLMLALLETYLFINFREAMLQILLKILEMVTRKLWYLERIAGLEALQKLMLQLYVYAFMEYPKTLNMLGMRVTPLTLSMMEHRPASLYITASMEKTQVKQKAEIKSAERRKPEIRVVYGSRTRAPETSIKREIGVTEDLTKDTIVHVGRDYQGKEMLFTALRYAYSMPFWLRRWLAREIGMPENHKYARYFGIGCIPSRRARYTWKKTRSLYEAGVRYHKDGWQKLMTQSAYEKTHPVSKGFKRLFRKFKLLLE